MTCPSDDLNDLTRDLRHLATLIGMITNMAIDVIEPDKSTADYQRDVGAMSDLLWIARDMVEAVADNSDAAHRKVLAERNAALKAVAS